MEQNQTNEKGYIDIKSHIIKTAIFLVVGIAFVLVLYFVNGMNLVNGLDACFITFLIFFGVGSMTIIINLGTFDALCYSFANMFATWHKDGKKKYLDLMYYKDVHKPKRHQRRFNFIDYYIVAVVFLVTSIILEIIYKGTL